MSRQTSERFEEISCAILVPLTTTVAFSINRRTMRPSRTSVGSWWDAAALFGELTEGSNRPDSRVRIVAGFLMRELCGTRAETTNDYVASGPVNLAQMHTNHLPMADGRKLTAECSRG